MMYLLEGTWSCEDHTIELAVHNTCEEQDFKLLLDRVRNLARYVRSSPDRRKAFREIQEERLIQEKNQAQNQNANDDDADDDNDDDDDDHDDDNHPPLISYLPRSCAEYRRQRRDRLANQKKPWNLILDVPTRWSSTFLMVERFVQLYEDILIYGFRGGLDQYDEYSNGRFIDLSELNTLKSWADALAPVADFVRIGEGEKYATLAWICPLFAHVLECVKPSGGLVAQAEKKFRKKLHGALNDRLGFLLKRVNMALAASALHPAFARLLFVSPRLAIESGAIFSNAAKNLVNCRILQHRRNNRLLTLEALNPSSKLFLPPTTKIRPSTSFKSVERCLRVARNPLSP